MLTSKSHVMLNDLPTIVDLPGDYVTRDGARVTIHEVKLRGDDHTTTEFLAKGSEWRMFRGKVRPHGFDIWHVSGRGFPLRESGRDIVGRYE